MKTEAEIEQKIEQIHAQIARDIPPEMRARSMALASMSGAINALLWVIKDDRDEIRGIGLGD